MVHTLAQACAAVWERLHILEEYDIDGYKAGLKDVVSRFEVWVSINGASRTDGLSLQWRIRKVSILGELLQERLKDLLEDLESLDQNVVSPQDTDDASYLTSQLLDAAHEDITALFKLTALAKQCTLRNSFVHSLSCVTVSVVEVEKEAEAIADLFPRLKQSHLEWLLLKLAQANGQRRQYLRYRELHERRIRDPESASDRDDAQSLATTVNAASFSKALAEDEVDSQSEASFVSYNTATGHDQMLFMKPLSTHAGQRGDFLCPYCREEQRISTQSSWERHVHADLRTYMCTAPDCGVVLFSNPDAWLQHQLDEHFTMCLICNAEPFSRDEQSNHEKIHESAAWTACNTISLSECRFCDWSGKLSRPSDTRVALKRYRRHMAAHLEQVALLTIDHDKIEEDRHSEASDEDETAKIVVGDNEADEVAATLNSIRSFNDSALRYGPPDQPDAALAGTTFGKVDLFAGHGVLARSIARQQLNSEAANSWHDLTYQRALDIARNSESGLDAAVQQYLGQACKDIRARIGAEPSSYIMSKDEFAVLNYFRERFPEPVFEEAIDRYWRHAAAG